MRKITYLLLFFITLNLSSQDILGHWYLHYTIDPDNTTTLFTEAPQADLTFQSTADSNVFEFNGFAGVINGFSGTTSILEPSYFVTSSFGWSLADCGGTSCYLESAYNLFWWFNRTTDPHTYDYIITGSGTEETLIIYNTVYNSETDTDEGYTAVYGRQILSLDDNSFKNQFKLTKNPVEQTLEITSERTIVDALFKIYNVDGKVLVTGSFKSEIAINDLSKGLYLIEVTTSKGEKEILRFVKQ